MKKYLASKVVGRTTKKSSNRGSSLPEVLVGAALITTMVAAAGYGLSSMVAANTASNARSDKRAEQNRSLDFVATEIRESTSLEKDAQNAANPSSPSGVTPAYAFSPSGSGAVKVLMVNVPNAPVPVVYYVAAPPAGSWKGPRVLYRWGPSFNAATGNYSNATTPNTWTNEVLIDNVPNASAASSILGGTPGPDRNCTSTTAKPNNGGTYSGDSGFNACVDDAGRTAVIYQDGQIAKVLGTYENSTASTNTGSRSLSASGPTARALPAGAISANLATTPPFTIVNGGVEVSKASTIIVQTLDGKGYPVATSLRVAVKPIGTAFTDTILGAGTLQTDARNATSQTYNVPAGSTISMAGCSNANGKMSGPWQDYLYYAGESTSGPSRDQYKIQFCPTSTNPSHQGHTVFTLKNGDAIYGMAGAGAGTSSAQSSLLQILTAAGMSSSNGTLVAKPNEIVYLFELATQMDPHQNHDLQDIVVKVTFN
jgi:hypothetical protein